MSSAPGASGDLDAWLARWKPSETDVGRCMLDGGWIWVQAPQGAVPAPAGSGGGAPSPAVLARCRAHAAPFAKPRAPGAPRNKAGAGKRAVDAILAEAQACGCTSGKWMLQCPPARVDAACAAAYEAASQKFQQENRGRDAGMDFSQTFKVEN